MFSELAAWQVQHFGLYFQKVRKEFDECKTQPPLAVTVEKFQLPTEESQQPQIQLMNAMECPRCWYVSQDKKNIVQIQRDGFFFNWRKTPPDAEYPRYQEHVRPGFVKQWQTFHDFLHEEHIAKPDVVQCEVTYVNHILKGQGWDSASDWPSMFSVLAPPTRAFLPQPESGRFNFNYVFPKESGRLRVSMHQAVRSEDGQEAVVLQMTSRGRPKSSATSDILEWFDLGREWIVRGFADITTDRMHKLWDRER